LLLALLCVNASAKAPMQRADSVPGIIARNAVARRMASASASARGWPGQLACPGHPCVDPKADQKPRRSSPAWLRPRDRAGLRPSPLGRC
jgi:hypothetical protein